MLTERFDVVVIANEVRRVPGDLSAEVVSLGKEHGAGQLTRGARYVRAVGPRSPAPGRVARAHVPVYLTLASLRSRRSRSVPSLLWFVHPADSRLLRASERLSDAVLTASPGSNPRIVPKIHVIGTRSHRLHRPHSDPA